MRKPFSFWTTLYKIRILRVAIIHMHSDFVFLTVATAITKCRKNDIVLDFSVLFKMLNNYLLSCETIA